MEKIVIKQISNPDNPELSYKHPGSMDFWSTKAGEDGKALTGLDENALYILRMEDGAAKTALQKKIKKDREELEKLLNVELGVNSDFWSSFFISIEDELTLDLSNPRDRLIEKWVVANRYAAPSQEAIEDDEDFYGCIYYLHREEEVLTKTVQDEVAKDEAIAKLVSLKNENPTKLILVVSNLLGYTADSNITADQAYLKAKEYLAADNKIQQKSKDFLAVAAKSSEDLMTKNILDKAIKKKIVSTRNKIFRRGEVEYGNSYEEALEYLLSIENSGELNSLKRAVDKA